MMDHVWIDSDVSLYDLLKNMNSENWINHEFSDEQRELTKGDVDDRLLNVSHMRM